MLTQQGFRLAERQEHVCTGQKKLECMQPDINSVCTLRTLFNSGSLTTRKKIEALGAVQKRATEL